MVGFEEVRGRICERQSTSHGIAASKALDNEQKGYCFRLKLPGVVALVLSLSKPKVTYSKEG